MLLLLLPPQLMVVVYNLFQEFNLFIIIMHSRGNAKFIRSCVFCTRLCVWQIIMWASCDKPRPIYLRRSLAEVELSARALEMVSFLRFFQQHLFCVVCSLFILNIIMNAVATQLEREKKKRQRSYSSCYCIQSREFNRGVHEKSLNDGDWYERLWIKIILTM